MAENQSIKRFIVRDPHGNVEHEDGFSVVGEVHVNIVPGYGEPYAEIEYIDGTLTITIHNIEGNGITDITTDSQEGDEAVNTVTIKTNANPEGVTLEVRNGSRGNGIASSSEVLSPDDGGINTHTITDTDGNEHVFHTKNGSKGDKGDQGDSAVYDSSSPDTPDFVMANTTGQSTTKAMTQKAVTDALDERAKIGDADEDVDLDICDTRGFILARFSGGNFQTKNFNSTHAATFNDIPVVGGESPLSDFEIADEDGNVLLRLAKGHIQTKKFNSEHIDTGKKLEGKTFSIIGDSISTYSGYVPEGYATFYPKGNIDSVEKTWWYQVAQNTGLSLLKNCSWSGSDMSGDSTSTESASAGCSTKRISDLADGTTNPDIIIIYIGINDFYHRKLLGTWDSKMAIPSEGVITTFSEAYALAVYKAIIAYPDAEIFCCSLIECKTADTDSAYPVINTNNEYLIDFNHCIKDVADGLGVHFVDVHKCGINYWEAVSDTLFDSTHPNAKGAALIAKYITNELINKSRYSHG